MKPLNLFLCGHKYLSTRRTYQCLFFLHQIEEITDQIASFLFLISSIFALFEAASSNQELLPQRIATFWKKKQPPTWMPPWTQRSSQGSTNQYTSYRHHLQIFSLILDLYNFPHSKSLYLLSLMPREH